MAVLPNRETKQWTVNPKEQYRAALSRAINVDLAKRPGRLVPTKMNIVSKEDDFGDTVLDSEVIAFGFYNGNYYANDTDQVLKGGTEPETAFAADTESGTPSLDALGDIENFNGSMYVSEANQVSKLTGTTWSTAFTGLTNGTKTLLKTIENRLYYTDNNIEIGSVNTSDAKATTTNTLDLGLSNNTSLKYEITMLEGGTNNVIIGTSNDGAEDNWVYFWNGETQNTFTARYKITANVLAGIVRKKDNRPYIFDSRGRLQAFNGSGFQTVARLPINGVLREDAVHYNGMTENEEDEILINFNNDTREDNYSPDAPSGVLAWHENTGIYTKYTHSKQSIGDTGTTNLTDYGQLEVSAVGAIFNAYERNNASNGNLLSSITYYNTPSEVKNAIFLNDTDLNTQSSSQIVTGWIAASAIVDTFTAVAAKHEQLLNSTDKVEVKYRTQDYTEVQGTMSYFSNYKVSSENTGIAKAKERFDRGERFELVPLRGDDAGKCFEVRNITGDGPGYVIEVTEAFTTASGDGRFLLENWKLAKGSQPEQEIATIGNVAKDGTKIQVKVNWTVTGPVDLEEIATNSKPKVKLT